MIGQDVGFGALDPRLACGHRRLRVLDLCLKIPGVELCEKLSSFNDRIEVGVNLLHLRRDLASHLNGDHGLHDTRGVDDVPQRPLFDRCREKITHRSALIARRK